MEKKEGGGGGEEGLGGDDLKTPKRETRVAPCGRATFWELVARSLSTYSYD